MTLSTRIAQGETIVLNGVRLSFTQKVTMKVHDRAKIVFPNGKTTGLNEKGAPPSQGAPSVPVAVEETGQ